MGAQFDDISQESFDTTVATEADTAERPAVKGPSSNQFLNALGDGWRRFRSWSSERPLAGGVLLIIAGLLVLAGPIFLLQFVFLNSMIPVALLVGALLVVMGIIQIVAPHLSLITGAVGVVLALISLIVAAGGFGLGVLLGLAGGALGIAWRSANETGHRTSRKVFGITYGLSLVALFGLFALIANGIVAMAAAIPVPVTVTASNIAGTNMQVVPGVSHADNQSPVGEIQMNADISNLVITKTFSTPLGNITLKMSSGSSSPAKLNGLTIDASALAADQADLGGLTINTGNSAGFSLNSSTANLTNANITSPYLVVNSITLPNLSISFSFGH